MRLVLVLVVLLVAAGCGVPRHMQRVAHVDTQPPPGCALVNFVRPSDWDGDEELAVFDGKRLVGILEDKSMFSVAVEPGEHYFISRRKYVSVIHARLLPGETYDVLVSSHALSAWSADVYMVPITAGSKERKRLDRWDEELKHLELVRDDQVEDMERRMAGPIDRIIRDFSGEKRDRLLELRPEDHR